MNHQCGRVKRIVRWGVESERLPADRWEALRAVRGLSAGRTVAPEPEPVTPVTEEHFRAALPHVRPAVGAILGLMMLTGMRPGEACRVRPCDIDTTGAVWVYRPPQHKTKYRGKARAVPIGERAKAILRRFTPADPTDFYFSPARTAAEQLAERTAKRRTPLYPSHARHNAKRRKQTPKRRPGRAYTTHGLAVAVTRACAKVAVPPWHPNQIRHTHATEVRRRFGLEAAQVVPGHERADVTQVYAEKNLALAAKVAAEIE